MAFLDKTFLFIHLLAIKGVFIYINPTLIMSVLSLPLLCGGLFFFGVHYFFGCSHVVFKRNGCIFACFASQDKLLPKSPFSSFIFFFFNVFLFYFCSLPGHGEQVEQSLWPGTAISHAEEALRELWSGHGQPGDHQHRAQPQPVLPQGRRSLQLVTLIHQSSEHLNGCSPTKPPSTAAKSVTELDRLWYMSALTLHQKLAFQTFVSHQFRVISYINKINAKNSKTNGPLVMQCFLKDIFLYFLVSKF